MIKVPHYDNIEEFMKHASFCNIGGVTFRIVEPEPNKIIKKLKWFWNGE